MATCDLGFDHEDAAAEPAPVIIEADPGPNENDVKIAEIEAAASIEREAMWTEQEGMRLDSEVQELRGELRGIREVLDRIAPPEPDPDPEPVVVEVPAATEIESAAAAVPETEPKETGSKNSGWWGSYK